MKSKPKLHLSPLYIQQTVVPLITPDPDDTAKDSLWNIINSLHIDMADHPRRFNCMLLKFIGCRGLKDSDSHHILTGFQGDDNPRYTASIRVLPQTPTTKPNVVLSFFSHCWRSSVILLSPILKWLLLLLP